MGVIDMKKYLRINEDNVDVMTDFTFKSGSMAGRTVPQFIASYPSVAEALEAHPDARGSNSIDLYALLNDVFGAEPDQEEWR